MNVRFRLAAVTLALLAPALLLARWSLGTGEPRIPPPTSLPSQVGEWTAKLDGELDAETLAIIEPDTYLVRLYEAPGRPPIWVYVGIYVGRAGTGKGAHTPEVCYPAQGWEIEHSRGTALPMEDGKHLQVQQLRLRRDLAREAVLYWFQPPQRWPTNMGAEEMLRVFDALGGHPQYAFVRFSAPYTETTWSDLAEFAIKFAPAVRGLVDRISVSVLEPAGDEASL